MGGRHEDPAGDDGSKRDDNVNPARVDMPDKAAALSDVSSTTRKEAAVSFSRVTARNLAGKFTDVVAEV